MGKQAVQGGLSLARTAEAEANTPMAAPFQHATTYEQPRNAFKLLSTCEEPAPQRTSTQTKSQK